MTSPPTPRMRGVVIPSEHGGWGLTLEPIVLGLAVAPSIPGLMIGVMALATFLFRTPFKIAAGDILRRRRLPRTLLAVQAAGQNGLPGAAREIKLAFEAFVGFNVNFLGVTWGNIDSITVYTPSAEVQNGHFKVAGRSSQKMKHNRF